MWDKAKGVGRMLGESERCDGALPECEVMTPPSR